MLECSVCSAMNFIFRFIYNIIATSLEYPLMVFLLSVLLAVALILNFNAAKLICDFNQVTTRRVGTDRSEMNSIDYGMERGPHTWNCEGENQSPINITDRNIVKLPIRELLTWNHYDDLPSSVTLENTGHTIIVKAKYLGNVPTLSGADLLASYTFVQICFRWSLLNGEGSEHMLNYHKFPLELQAMHRTGPAEDCVSSYDLLMVAYFFEVLSSLVDRRNNILLFLQLSTHNPYLDPLIQNLHRIKKPGTKIQIASFPISYLCYQFRSGFYSYGGSLTEPPCYPGAEWFIFPETFAISERQLNEFRQTISSNGKNRIVRNARPVQNISSSRVVNLNEYTPLEMSSSAELSLASMSSTEILL